MPIIDVTIRSQDQLNVFDEQLREHEASRPINLEDLIACRVLPPLPASAGFSFDSVGSLTITGIAAENLDAPPALAINETQAIGMLSRLCNLRKFVWDDGCLTMLSVLALRESLRDCQNMQNLSLAGSFDSEAGPEAYYYFRDDILTSCPSLQRLDLTLLNLPKEIGKSSKYLWFGLKSKTLGRIDISNVEAPGQSVSDSPTPGFFAA